MISADSQGNGGSPRRSRVLRRQGGTIRLVNFGVDYFSTNERTKGVREWMQNRPDIKMKQSIYRSAKVSQIAGDFLTANRISGIFAVWDQPALDTLSSMRAKHQYRLTVDLGLQSASRSPKAVIKATGSQRPYDRARRRPRQ
jgi:ribose transport system substrate-binding protein